MRLTTIGIAGLLLVSVSACAVGGSEPEASPEAEDACALLSTGEVAALAGEDPGEPEPGEVSGLPVCRWGSPESIGVQVVDVPVTEWVTHLEPVLDEAERSGLADDPATAAKFEKARELLASGEVDDVEGCELFGLFLEIQGLDPGQTRTVNVIPNAESPEGVTAQTCVDGRFSSVLIQGSAVTGSDAEIQRADDALDAVLAHAG